LLRVHYISSHRTLISGLAVSVLLQRRTLNRIEYSINSLLNGLDIGKMSLGMWSCYFVEYPHDCPHLWLDRRKSRNQITLSSLSQKIERQIKFFLVRMMDILDNAFLKVKLNLTKNIFTNPELIVNQVYCRLLWIMCSRSKLKNTYLS
jgi:hypothetical protein